MGNSSSSTTSMASSRRVMSGLATGAGEPDRPSAPLHAAKRMATAPTSMSIGMIELRSGPTKFNFRSEVHTSELQSLMRISYAVFCFKKKTKTHNTTHHLHDKQKILTTN